MTYIQRKDEYNLETVDEFKTFGEAKAMIKEYRLSDSYGHYYLSQRACKGWNK